MSCLRDILKGIRGGRVLDAACGTGRLTHELAECLDGFESIVGIDPDKTSLDEARRFTQDRRIRYRLSGIMDLPPDPLRFDTVSIGYALHHLSDPAAGLSRLVEVLLPGGMLIVDEPVCDGLEEAQQTSRDIHHFKAGIDRLNGRVHNPTMTSDEVVALVENYGLNDLQTCRENPDSDVGYEQHRSEARSFLDSYLDHIEGRAEHAEFRAVRDHLLAEMERTGLQPQSHIVVVARKPTG